jgi:hypothetical protein
MVQQLEFDQNQWEVRYTNINEIFRYKQKRKIEINNDNKLLDKNFTFILTFHPISPYTFNDNNQHFIKSEEYKTPVEFFDSNNQIYQNYDAFN